MSMHSVGVYDIKVLLLELSGIERTRPSSEYGNNQPS